MIDWHLASLAPYTNKILHVSYAVGLILIGFIIAKRLSHAVEKIMAKHFSRHHTLLLDRLLFYFVAGIFMITGLQQLGFNLSVLLGAAGVFTVAISFASQTAASNLISGIFLLFEQPFKVGDTVEIKGITGVIDSIDLLSTKLKTSDNKLVRIPNEALIKSEITNLSFFKTRRIDLLIEIAYENDISEVKNILLAIAQKYELALPEPEPTVIINNFTTNAVELKFMIWANTNDLGTAKSDLQERIQQAFGEEGISIPLPQLTIQRS